MTTAIEVHKGGALTKRELAASKLYPNINTPEKAAVVIAKAKSYGLCPTTVADGLFFVGGKPAMSAQLIATLLKRSGKYDFRVKTKTAKEVSIEFFELLDGKRESLGVETFNMEDAKRAGLDTGVNWKKFPAAMLWARALTAGVRARCPDALGGNPVYSVEELAPAVEVDEEGRPIIDVEVVPTAHPPAGIAKVRDLIARTHTDEGALLAHYGASSLEGLTASQADDAVHTLTEKLAAM